MSSKKQIQNEVHIHHCNSMHTGCFIIAFVFDIAWPFQRTLAIGYVSYRGSPRLSLTCSGISPLYMYAAVQQGNSAMGTLNVYCYVMFSTPPPIKFCSLSLSSLISSSSSNINFIHNHTWSLYIRSLAFECCNIALVIYIAIRI